MFLEETAGNAAEGQGKGTMVRPPRRPLRAPVGRVAHGAADLPRPPFLPEGADVRGLPPGGRTIRGDQGHLMLGERIASQSEVIRAISSGYSPCCGVAHVQSEASQSDDAERISGYNPDSSSAKRSANSGAALQLQAGGGCRAAVGRVGQSRRARLYVVEGRSPEGGPQNSSSSLSLSSGGVAWTKDSEMTASSCALRSPRTQSQVTPARAQQTGLVRWRAGVLGLGGGRTASAAALSAPSRGSGCPCPAIAAVPR